jgi:hypothetical protein
MGPMYCIVLFAGAVRAAEPDIWTASAKGDLDAIRHQIAAGADVNGTFVLPDVPGSGGTPLHIAVLAGQMAAAELLLERGADVNARAADKHRGTPLHWAAFTGRTGFVVRLIRKGADVNAADRNGYTPLDAARHQMGGKPAKAAVVSCLREHGAKSRDEAAAATGTGIRGAYFVNGEIHVNTYGMPESKPLTSGHWDFKPSWSKTGDMLVFFRRLRDDPVVTNWKTAVCVINVDGSGFHQLTDGTHTDFNQTWTRDGTNTPIWNRKKPETGGFCVMASKVRNKPGQEIALTDRSHHTWAYSCLMDGRILVQCDHPRQGWGYFLMAPGKNGGQPHFERIDCELAKEGILDRVSVSPSERQVCFEYQRGFKYKNGGRTLCIADFDAKKPAITNSRPFANEQGANRWFAYPRWTKDEAAIVYHASPSLFLYTLRDGSTRQVSTNPRADYRYPHCEATPK